MLPTYKRLKAAGGENVHLSYWDKVVDHTGKYKGPDGAPFEYYGHWSWIYMLNNECRLDFDGSPVTIDGNPVTIVEWLAAQRNA